MSKKKKNKSQEVKEQKISNDDYLKGHLVRENDREWVVLKPSYWLFNAGLVGIIRTIEEGKNYKEPENSEENQGYEKSIHLKKINQILCEISDGNIDNYKFYKFSKNGALLIDKKVWKKLPEMYVEMMSYLFNTLKSYWYNKIFSTKGNLNIMQNKINPQKIPNQVFYKFPVSNTDISKVSYLLLGLLNPSDTLKLIEILIAKDVPSEEKLRLIDVLVRTIEELKYEFKSNNKIKVPVIDGSKLKKGKEIEFKESKINDKIEMIRKIDVSMEDIKRVLKKVNESFYYVFKNTILYVANKYIIEVIKTFQIEKSEVVLCSLCGNKTSNYRYMDMSLFTYEGGSKNEFKNYYWCDETQVPICKVCDTILFFYPIGIGIGSEVVSEFINIPHAEYLWLLNKYRMDLEKTLEEKRSFEGVRSRLVDAVTSTSAILRLKSRWLLQNVEFIEIGGIREKSVHVLEIHPVALELLYDFLDYRIQEWVSKVEKLNKTINESTLKGRKLIGFFLNGEAGMLIKTVLPFIKMEFSSENKKNKKDFYFWEQMRASINVSLSLLEGMPAREDFYYLGKNLKGLLNDNDKVKNLCSKLLPLIITGRKEKFVEELLRTYMTLGVEVPDKVVEFLCAESTQNHISSKGDLLFKCRALQFFIGLWNGKGGFYE